MGDYTPRLDAVRGRYLRAGALTREARERSRKEFDRWLAAHDAEVRIETLREMAAHANALADALEAER